MVYPREHCLLNIMHRRSSETSAESYRRPICIRVKIEVVHASMSRPKVSSSPLEVASTREHIHNFIHKLSTAVSLRQAHGRAQIGIECNWCFWSMSAERVMRVCRMVGMMRLKSDLVHGANHRHRLGCRGALSEIAGSYHLSPADAGARTS